MSAQAKPRAADVVRWVAALNEPFPAGQGRRAIKAYQAEQRIAVTRLAQWGLDAYGKPRATVPA